MNQSTFDELQAKLSHSPISAKTKDVAAHIGKLADVDDTNLEPFIDVIINVAKSTNDITVSKMAESLSTAIWLNDIGTEKKANLLSRLAVLSEMRSLQLLAKMKELLYDNQRTFLDCRIITDVRTLFDKPEDSARCSWPHSYA